MASKNVLGLSEMGTVDTPMQRYSNTDHNVGDTDGVGALTPREVNPMGVAPISGNRSGMDMSDGTGGCTSKGSC